MGRENQTEIIELTRLTPPRRTAFGEFLVEQRMLDRYQLFRALQVQDVAPDTRLGHCAVALGFLPRDVVERLHRSFTERAAAELDAAATTSFPRQAEPEIEVEITIE